MIFLIRSILPYNFYVHLPCQNLTSNLGGGVAIIASCGWTTDATLLHNTCISNNENNKVNVTKRKEQYYLLTIE